MKKRLPLLALCLILIASMLVSCGETLVDQSKDYINNNDLLAQEPEVTLNLYIPCEVEIDDSALIAMQKEFNTVTEAKYKTRIAFHMVPMAEYKQAVLAQAAVGLENKDEELDMSPSSVNDTYPKENEIQFDMFVALDQTMVSQMITAGYIANLTPYLGNTSSGTVSYNRLLSDQTKETSIPICIYDNVTVSMPGTAEDGSATTLENQYVGIPANFLLGKYTYYVIDKQVADRYYFSQDESNTTRVDDLKEEMKDALGDAAGISLFNSTVQEVQGDYRLRYTYDESEYYVCVKENPTGYASDLFRGMFCISSACRYQDRAIQVLTELFTNTKLHTTLQYGAENVTYKLKTTTVEGATYTYVELMDGAPAYRVNNRYTGNLANLYPCPALNYDDQFAHYLYLQNRDATITH